MQTPPTDSRERARTLLMGLQDSICAGLESLDGEGRFQEESWVRQEGGGGRSRVIKAGRVFEQGGVNFSEVEGDRLPPSILSQRPEAEGHRWFAIGTSMVLHPRNPYIPTVHLNYRYFQAGPVWWFGGGADLTPYYPYLDDARHFHRTLEAACGAVNPAYYPVFKLWCDEYFFLKHRGETRGVGGIFFDYQDGSGVLYRGPDATGPAAAASAEIGPVSHDWETAVQSGDPPVATPFCPAMCRSPRSGRTPPMASGSGSSSSTAGVATWNSTSSSTGARSSASRPMAAPNPS